jgi:hypothetical protein
VSPSPNDRESLDRLIDPVEESLPSSVRRSPPMEELSLDRLIDAVLSLPSLPPSSVVSPSPMEELSLDRLMDPLADSLMMLPLLTAEPLRNLSPPYRQLSSRTDFRHSGLLAPLRCRAVSGFGCSASRFPRLRERLTSL